MRLDDLTITLRPREPWEAVDLGYRMVRAWARPLYASWLAVFLPFAVAVVAWGEPWALVGLWWVKPLFDRVPLHVLSRATFGVRPSVGETLRALPSLLGGYLFGALVVQRCSPTRSFLLPTWQLEGLTGRERARRAGILRADGDPTAQWLTVAAMAMELGASLALLALVRVLFPESVGVDWGLLFERYGAGVAPGWFERGLLALPVVAFAALEPFYVGGGFALYLNRRTLLEGWDLDIAFRRLAGRAEALRDGAARPGRSGPPAASALLGAAWLAAACLAASCLAASPSRAAPAAEGSWTGEPDPADVVREVLADPDFGTETTREVRRVRTDLFDAIEGESAPTPWAAGAGLARLLEVTFWAVIVALVTWLLVLGLRQAGVLAGRSRRGRGAAPTSLFGLDVTPESLPDDVPAEAERLWREGRQADALGLLYRAALSRLVRVDELPLRESHTEEDCLAIARGRVAPERGEYLARLTRSWQATAYARRPPGDAQAAGLWSAWNAHFGEAT